jgi:hypothetical protein
MDSWGLSWYVLPHWLKWHDHIRYETIWIFTLLLPPSGSLHLTPKGPNENMRFATSYPPPRKMFQGCSRYSFADGRTASQKVCHGNEHGSWPLCRGAGHSADRRSRWNWMKCIASNQCVRKLRWHKIAILEEHTWLIIKFESILFSDNSKKWQSYPA